MQRTAAVPEKITAQGRLRRAWLRRFLLFASASSLQAGVSQAGSASTAVSASSTKQTSPLTAGSATDSSYAEVFQENWSFRETLVRIQTIALSGGT